MSVVQRIVPWVLIVKSIDVIGSGMVRFETPFVAGALGAALVASALVWWRHQRAGAGMAAIVLLVLAAGPLYRNHIAFLAWIAVLTALSRDEQEQRLLLTVHLSVVYAFATLVKLTPLWLSGDALAARPVLTFGIPVVVLAWATVIVEAALAVAVWRPSRGWFGVAIVTHVSFVVGMGASWLDALRLSVFNVAILTVWLALHRCFVQEPPAPVLAPVRRSTPVPA